MTVKVAIAGAGVGGLTLAAALEGRGFEVTVYEQSPGLRQQGSGLSLYTNAVSALRGLGLWGVVEGIAEPVERMLALSAGGRVLTELDVGHASRRFSAPNVNVHRGELLAALGDAVSGGTIAFGARCVGFDQDEGGVRLRFADGAEARADLLVAADGAGSAVRSAVHATKGTASSERATGDRERRWSGWQGVAPSRPGGVPEDACAFVLNGRAVAGLLPLRGGRLHWFVDDPRSRRHVQNVQGLTQDEQVYDALEEMTGALEAWPPLVRDTVAKTPPGSVSYDTIRDRLPPQPPQQWGEGRVTLLGDAAHPMLPTLGQGACQSIEDAVALVKRLEVSKTDGNIEVALREYERVRSKRAAAFVRASRSSSDFRSRMPPALRDAVIRAAPRRLLSYSFARSISPAKL